MYIYVIKGIFHDCSKSYTYFSLMHLCDNPHDGLMAQHLCLLLLVFNILILLIEMGNLQTYICRFFCYLNIFIIAYVGNLDVDLVILVFSYNNSN